VVVQLLGEHDACLKVRWIIHISILSPANVYMTSTSTEICITIRTRVSYTIVPSIEVRITTKNQRLWRLSHDVFFTEHSYRISYQLISRNHTFQNVHNTF